MYSYMDLKENTESINWFSDVQDWFIPRAHSSDGDENKIFACLFLNILETNSASDSSLWWEEAPEMCFGAHRVAVFCLWIHLQFFFD